VTKLTLQRFSQPFSTLVADLPGEPDEGEALAHEDVVDVYLLARPEFVDLFVCVLTDHVSQGGVLLEFVEAFRPVMDLIPAFVGAEWG
jgi:hypothetical protein